MLRWNKAFALLGGIATTVAVTACESPDVEGRFNEYSELVGQGDPAPVGFCNTQTPLGEGTYLLRLQHSINKKRHIYFEVTMVDAGSSFTATFQPLKSDEQKAEQGGGVEPRPDARTPIGDPIVMTDLVPDEKGIVTLSAEHVIVPGEANSTTFGTIDADFELKIAYCDNGEYCGEGVMQTYEPISMKNVKSNYGAVKVEPGSDYKEVDVPFACR